MSQFTAEFIQERVYLKGVSTETVKWYHSAFKAFANALESKQTIIARISELKARGLQNSSVNSHLRVVNAYQRWLHTEKGVPLLKLPKLKEQSKVLMTFSAEHVERLFNAKPVGRNDARVRIMALTAVDTGLRIQELLNLRRPDVDLENLMLKVNGKGNSQRLVPMSLELRKLLYRYLGTHKFDRVFPTGRGNQPTQRNLHRDFKALGKRLQIIGVRVSFHTLRHTFAVNYLRAGGNVLYLQRILGHASLEMTNRYCRSLGIDDLKAAHAGLTLLSARR